MKKKTKTPTKNKTTAKKATRKTSPKRKSAVKVVKPHKVSATRKRKNLPSGYMLFQDTDILVPTMASEPVLPKKIRSGIERSKEEISKLMKELSDLTDGYEIKEIELAVSFSADGKFLGIGVGGATTIKIRFMPNE